jgi:hypothetical protein
LTAFSLAAQTSITSHRAGHAKTAALIAAIQPFVTPPSKPEDHADSFSTMEFFVRAHFTAI